MPTANSQLEALLSGSPVGAITGDINQGSEKSDDRRSQFEKPPAAKTKLDSLTFLRFLAALSIVLHHSMDTFRLPSFLSVVLNPALAVSFFFVLSGFILSYVYPRLSGKGEVLRFWQARIARCWPLHLICFLIVAYVLRNGLGFDPDGFPRRGTAITNALLLQAWVPNQAYFFGYNAPSWSVSVEFFFYFCFPFLQMWRSKGNPFLKSSIMLIVAASFAFICSALLSQAKGADLQLWLAYINPLARLFEFVLGMFCATIYSRILTQNNTVRATIAQAICFTIFVAFLANIPRLVPVGCPVQVPFALVTGLLILSLALDKGVFSRCLSGKLACKLGDISYAMYLLHYLLSNFNHHFWEQYAATNNVIAFAVYISLVIGISLGAHQLIELPLRNLLTWNRKAYT
jgi:peptidoglycan/LPS O-acetylase OafA/YrhL